MPKILLLNDTSGIENWGCQASAEGLASILEAHIPGLELRAWSQEKLARTFSSVKLPLLPTIYRPVGGSHSRKRVRAGFRGGSRPASPADTIFPPNANYYELSRQRWLSEPSHPLIAELSSELQSVDLVLHNAELLNFSHNAISQRGAFICWLASIEYGIPAGMINQTTPPIEGDPVMRGVLRRVCPELAPVTVRETRSFEAMGAWGIACELVPDPAFWFTESEFDAGAFSRWRREHNLEGQRYFCLSASSGLPVAGGAGSFTCLIRDLQRAVPHAVLLAAGGGGWLMKAAAAKISNCHVYDGPYPALWPLLQHAEFLVSGHYHNLIFAAMVGCPFVPLAGISHKIQGLLELLEWPYPRCYNPTALELEIGSIVDQAAVLLDEKSDLGGRLRGRAEELRAVAGRTGELARAALDAQSSP
jgi:hypothetical protein